MNFANWLSKVSDFVNLGNLLTSGGPGMILALALFVIGAHALEIPIFVTANSDFPSHYPASIPQHEMKVQWLERELATVERAKAATDAGLASAQADLKTLDTQIDAAEKQSVAVARTERLKRERGTKRDGLEELAAQKAAKDVEFQTKKRLLDEAQKELSDLRGTMNVTATNLLDNVLSHLIGLVFIGYLLGSLMAPLNRVLFLDWFNAIASWFD